MTRGTEIARSLACIAAVATVVLWVRSLPAELHGLDRVARGDETAPDVREVYRFRGDDGRQHVYAGGFDGYAWAIAARKLERTGSLCDAAIDGDCRDLTSLAPHGRSVRYPHSLHIRAIAAVHGALQTIRPGAPLLEALALLPSLIAVLAVAPAYALGFRLAGGWVGGVIVALVSGLNPLLLLRTLNGDNDIWSYFFPLLLAWLVAESILARRGAVAIGCAAVAGAAVGPYATIWNGWPFAWAMAAVGLTANAVLIAVARSNRVSGDGVALRRAIIGAVVFVLAAGVATELAGAAPSYLDALPHLLGDPLLSAPAEAAAGPPLAWPDPYAAVGELRSIGFGEVAGWLGGRVYLFAAWIGLLLMLLPRREWRTVHFATFVGGIVVYRLLLSTESSPSSRLLLVAGLAAPLVAAVAIYAFDAAWPTNSSRWDTPRRRKARLPGESRDPGGEAVASGLDPGFRRGDKMGRRSDWRAKPFDAREGARRRAAIAIVAWFAAALYLSLGSVRFLLLLVPPFAVAIAVGIDRARGVLSDSLASSPRPARVLAAVSMTAAVVAVLYGPLRAGWVVARDYLPQVNDAWYAVLADLRDNAPADAIVSTWWSYGYFAGYFSERRVTADGGTLYSSAPYWVARAMMSPSRRHSAGILRLLHCGGGGPRMTESSLPLAPLLAAGLSQSAAVNTIDEMVGLGANEAAALLRGLGVPDREAATLLATTHCDPPPAYLVLSDLDGRDLSWQRMASWSFARAHAARAVSRSGASAVANELQASFALESAAAREVAAAAREAMRTGSLVEFPSELRAIVPSAWAPCRSVGAAWECSVRSGPVTGVELRLDQPSASRLRGVDWGAPSYFAVLQGGEVSERIASGAAAGWGVLVDVDDRRALVGNAATLRSTWARLMLLDGAGGEIFERVSAQRAAGEGVAAWRVRWDRLEDSHG